MIFRNNFLSFSALSLAAFSIPDFTRQSLYPGSKDNQYFKYNVKY